MLLAVAVAGLPASLGFVAGAAAATTVSVADAMPDCDHHHHGAPHETQKSIDHAACLAACAASCVGFPAADVTGIAYSAPVSAALKPVRARINVSSLMGQVGYPNSIAYCATKGAVTAMTKTAAIEGAQMSPKVRVNSLHPGVIWTPMITGTFGDDQALADAFAADTPLRMIGRPEYMADAICYLISDDAAYVTGAELTADGGRGAD